jgi:hypothetical protein
MTNIINKKEAIFSVFLPVASTSNRYSDTLVSGHPLEYSHARAQGLSVGY